MMVFDELQRMRVALERLEGEVPGETFPYVREAFAALEAAIVEAWPPPKPSLPVVAGIDNVHTGLVHTHNYASGAPCGADCALMGGFCGRPGCPWSGPANFARVCDCTRALVCPGKPCDCARWQRAAGP